MSSLRPEISAPASGLTVNEQSCLRALREAGPNVTLTTAQIANQAKPAMHTSSALVALERLVERGLVGRSDRVGRPSSEPVRWFLIDNGPAAA